VIFTQCSGIDEPESARSTVRSNGRRDD
jgi:hypothetical protein